MGSTVLGGSRVLITGGLGFIGSTLARRLVADGAHVTIVDSLVPEYGGSLHNIDGLEAALRVNISDIRDEHSLRHLVAGQEYLFNLAGQTSHMDSMTDPFTDLEINCRAQLSVLEACRAHNPGVRVVYASTRQVYGRPLTLPVDEAHPLRPVDVNGIHKLAGEWYHLLYNEVYSLWSCVLRFTNTYGPRMRVRDDRQTFLGGWIRLLIQGRPFEVWGGSQLRDLTFVDDAVDALILAARADEARGQVFNIGAQQTVSLLELAELLVRVNGGGEFSVRAFPADRKRIDIGDYVADWGKIRAALGWQPSVPLEEGLRRTLAFYKAQGEHYW